MARTAGGTTMAMLQSLLFLILVVPSTATGIANGSRKFVNRREAVNIKKASYCAPAPAPSPAIAGDSPDQFRGKLRLPRFATPRRYELHFRPDLVAFTFSGTAAIVVAVSAPTRYLVVNAAELSVDRASVCFQGLAPIEVVFFEDDEIMVLGFGKELPLGVGVLRMDFNGTLNDKLRGFYRSKYQYKGEMAYMAVTDFEPMDARRCFPCWDEPSFKAKFKLTLEVPSELVALSNMPIASETVYGPTKTVHYEESPLMSTYLVAMVIGRFDYVEGVTSQGTKVRVYTEVGKREQGKFALDVGVKSLDLYKDYFDTPYALPKLDMIGIPDFGTGAMENFGLVTFQVSLLLLDEQSSTSTKQNIAIVVAHELAHQWCGNLVTMEWWTHLWLNEGFATWMSYLAVDSFFPQWNIWTQSLSSKSYALKLDSLAGSHPIEVQIHHANETQGVFDAITYQKGASILRMLQSYLGAERFQKALASYIKKYAYSNANTEELWAVLEEETGEPVMYLMTAWVKQQGYPVISAKRKGHSMELHQAQFLLDGSPGNATWVVPIISSCDSYHTQKKILLKHRHAKLDICGNREKGGKFWIKLNINETGFYRVKYDNGLTAALQNALEANKFSSLDKIGIIENSLALCMVNDETLASLLRILYACREEADYYVLQHINDITSAVAKISIDATPHLAGDMEQLFIKILLSPTEKIGWDPRVGESDMDISLRQMLLVALVKLGHNKTINEGVRRFSVFMQDRNTSLLPPHTRKAAYLSVMHSVSSSNRSGYDALRKIYRESADGEEKLRILGVLSSCQDKDIVLESLNFIFTDEVRNQDAYAVLGGVNTEARETAWSWFEEHWDRISKEFSGSSVVWSFIGDVVPLFTTNEKATEISRFFTSHTDPTLERPLKLSIETVRINARWIHGIRTEPRLAKTVHLLLHKP